MDINATLLGQMLTFALLIWFTMKFVWPPLQQALVERRETIQEGLAQAEKGRRSLEEAAIQVAELLKQNRAQAALIIEEAHKRATLIIDEAKKQAQEEQQHEINRAKAEIQQLAYAAKEDLKDRVVAISLLAVERMIHKTMDAKEQEALLADLVEQL